MSELVKENPNFKDQIEYLENRVIRSRFDEALKFVNEGYHLASQMIIMSDYFIAFNDAINQINEPDFEKRVFVLNGSLDSCKFYAKAFERAANISREEFDLFAAYINITNKFLSDKMERMNLNVKKYFVYLNSNSKQDNSRTNHLIELSKEEIRIISVLFEDFFDADWNIKGNLTPSADAHECAEKIINFFVGEGILKRKL